MNRTRIAEWILSLALPNERAAAVVGDLAESVEERGRLWFWSCVLRLTGAKIWQDLSERPLAMIWLGVRGFVASALAPVACMLLVVFVLFLIDGHGDIRTRHDWAWSLLVRNVAKPSAPPDIELQRSVQWTMMLFWTAWIFRTGRAVARRTPGREIPACLAVSILGWIAILAAQISSAQVMLAARTSFALVWMGLAHDLALFAGALQMRLQRKQTA